MDKFFSFNQLPLYTDDFFLTSLTDLTVNDAIVILNPPDAMWFSPVFLRSRKTLEEHISYIQKNEIKKAIIVANDISFLSQCPGLEYIWIIPEMNAKELDYSPLYEMPNIKWLQCSTLLGNPLEDLPEKNVYIDYARIKGIQSLYVMDQKGHENVADIKTLRSLVLSDMRPSSGNLVNAFDGEKLENLVISSSGIRSLEGIERAHNLRRIELIDNRRLADISHLSQIKDSLEWLHIENCSKIKDFSILHSLKNLKLLRLCGSNTIPNLSFLKNMPNLEFLIIRINVQDGDLALCDNIPYVGIQNRRHYNRKDSNMSKRRCETTDIDKYINEII